LQKQTAQKNAQLAPHFMRALYVWRVTVSSVNHHYVPQLYLRGFTAEDGKLQVFDKELLHFKKDKQTPKTVLFDKHRNTINFKGCPTDQVEKLYGLIETPFGEFFNHVRKGISQNELISKDGIYLLKLFIATQFWRMPLLDKFANDYIENIDLGRFGTRITFNGNPLGEVKEISQLLKTDLGFRHYFRSFFLPLLMFDSRVHERDYHCWRLHTVAEEDGNWDNFLTGDNPLIIQDITEVFSFNSKILMPLSKTQLITYSPLGGNRYDFPAIFSTKMAMVMNSQSQKYLVGANREYMEKIVELQGELYGSEGEIKLRDEIFEYI
jgi:hypothetical protein